VSSRLAPALHLILRLEEPGEAILAADSHEDELRLRAWLRRTHAVEQIPAILERLLDELDDRDLGQAA